MLERLLPRKNEFFALFSHHATLCVDGAGKLREMLDDLGHAEQCAAGIHVIEHEADGVCQQAMELLHTSFITPIGRGDIYSISSRLDDILDHIEATAQNLWLYEVSTSRPEAFEMAAHLVEATLAMKATVEALAKRPVRTSPT